jgi:hypothetical protein
MLQRGKEPRQRGQRGQVLRGVGYIHPRDDNLVALMVAASPIWGNNRKRRQRFLDVLNAPDRFSDERTLQ